MVIFSGRVVLNIPYTPGGVSENVTVLYNMLELYTTIINQSNTFVVNIKEHIILKTVFRT